MNVRSSYVVHSNIKRLQNLLGSSGSDAERQTIQKLLAEEQIKALDALGDTDKCGEYCSI